MCIKGLISNKKILTVEIQMKITNRYYSCVDLYDLKNGIQRLNLRSVLCTLFFIKLLNTEPEPANNGPHLTPTPQLNSLRLLSENGTNKLNHFFSYLGLTI